MGISVYTRIPFFLAYVLDFLIGASAFKVAIARYSHRPDRQRTSNAKICACALPYVEAPNSLEK